MNIPELGMHSFFFTVALVLHWSASPVLLLSYQLLSSQFVAAFTLWDGHHAFVPISLSCLRPCLVFKPLGRPCDISYHASVFIYLAVADSLSTTHAGSDFFLAHLKTLHSLIVVCPVTDDLQNLGRVSDTTQMSGINYYRYCLSSLLHSRE